MVKIEMNMPLGCYDCQISYLDNGLRVCPFAGRVKGFYTKRPSKCPLQECEK